MATQIIGFPPLVNERAARIIAGAVAALGIVALVTGWHVITALLAVGFLLRVVGGPRMSPLGRLVADHIAPRLGPPIPTAGPPKRFAQGVGLVVTTIAAVGSLGFGLVVLPAVLVAVLVFFAVLESSVGWCAGCWAFARLMEWGLIPEETCEACSNLALARR
ncbi:MAG: DUF4395 domain-containing protein [Dermatophilaceae bacterium]